jgi:hypothetical protein
VAAVINLPLAETREWSQRAAKSDTEVLAFAETEPCLLCDEPVGEEGTIAIFPDLSQLGLAFVAAECLSCAARRDRHRREGTLCATRFPGGYGLRLRRHRFFGLFWGVFCGTRFRTWL